MASSAAFLGRVLFHGVMDAPGTRRRRIRRMEGLNITHAGQITTCRREMLRRICVVQIQSRKHVLDHAGYTAPARQAELDHTDHTDHTDHADHADLADQEPICPVRQI